MGCGIFVLSYKVSYIKLYMGLLYIGMDIYTYIER